jgi:hypothetical protein
VEDDACGVDNRLQRVRKNPLDDCADMFLERARIGRHKREFSENLKFQLIGDAQAQFRQDRPGDFQKKCAIAPPRQRGEARQRENFIDRGYLTQEVRLLG